MRKRWKLLVLLGLLGLLAAINTLQHRAAFSSPATSPATVGLAQADTRPVPDGEVETLVRQAVALAGGLEGIIEPGDTVVVKPNVGVDADVERGVTTDPRVARAVVRLAQEAGAGQVLIAEGAAACAAGCDRRRATREDFHYCGYDDDWDMHDDETGVPLVDLNDAGGYDQHDPNLVRQVVLQHGLMWNSYWLPTAILDADVVIGVPVLKNHTHTGVTLALKNQFGIAPLDIYHGPGSYCWKGAFSHATNDLGRHIVDLNLARPLDFAVVDGLRGVIDGQFGWTIIDPPMGLILAGSDAVAVDTVGALVMGYDPATIPHLGLASGAGLGTSDTAQITVRGQSVSQVRRDFPAPYGDVQAQRANPTPPSVTLEAPDTAAVVANRTTVWATASDDQSVARVAFYAGDQLQAVVTSPPYQASLDLAGFRGQDVTLRAVAYDRALNDDEDTASVHVTEAPAPGTASLHTATVSIPTYPYAGFLHSRTDPTYNITYRYLDWDGYQASSPTPSPQDYTLLILENDFLQVTLLPELGGRIYQMIYKPTGHNELYQNPVIKPTHWGPLDHDENWWLAAGGIEWGLPVYEHGYEWGEPWSYEFITSTAGVTVTLQDTAATDRIRARVAVFLPAGQAILAVTPHVENPTGSEIDYKYWTNGMLAPGAANTVSAETHFVFPGDRVEVHSSGDGLPEHSLLDWPVHGGTDYSRLGNWDHWLGFFEYPQASDEGFAGVYDASADEGVARVFPPDVARGSKGFGFGWKNPIDWDNWTDDGSTYVELHGGLAPTFWHSATLPAGGSSSWTETWYPVSGIGRLTGATGEAALGIEPLGDTFRVGLFSTISRTAGTTTLYAWDRTDCTELAQRRLPATGPAGPLTVDVPTGGRTLDGTTFAYLDEEGNVLATVNGRDCLPPTATVEPLPWWVATPDFPVAWAGTDVWSEVAHYDVQVRDGYEGSWVDWLTATTGVTATFTGGSHGHTYFFRARAQDTAGNQGPYGDEEWGQAFTTVLTGSAPVLVTSRKAATPRQPGQDQIVAYTFVVSNTGSAAAGASLTDTLPGTMVLLTKTLSVDAGPSPTYADGRVRWSGAVGAGEQVQVTYVLSPTAETPVGIGLTNTVEIAGSVLGPFYRQATITRMWKTWLPLITQGYASPQWGD